MSTKAQLIKHVYKTSHKAHKIMIIQQEACEAYQYFFHWNPSIDIDGDVAETHQLIYNISVNTTGNEK